MKISRSQNVYLFGLLLLILFSACARVENISNKQPVEANKTETATPTPERQFPEPMGFVTDLSGVLDQNFKDETEAVLRRLRDKAQIDFAIAIVDSTNGKDIFDYSLGMTREWKIGSENGGALLLVAIKDKKWHIQIDKRLETDLSNEEVRQIGEVMVPDFKQDKYADGIKKCVEKMISVLALKQHFEPIEFKTLE